MSSQIISIGCRGPTPGPVTTVQRSRRGSGPRRPALPGPTPANSLQRHVDPGRIVEVLKGDVAPGAQSPAAHRVLRVPLDGEHPPILHVSQYAAILTAEETTGFPYCGSLPFQLFFAAQPLFPFKYLWRGHRGRHERTRRKARGMIRAHGS